MVPIKIALEITFPLTIRIRDPCSENYKACHRRRSEHHASRNIGTENSPLPKKG